MTNYERGLIGWLDSVLPEGEPPKSAYAATAVMLIPLLTILFAASILWSCYFYHERPKNDY